MVEFLFSYLNSDVLGKIDNSHLAIADRSAKKALDEKCLELAKLHSEAVDFVKHGQPVSVDKSLFAKGTYFGFSRVARLHGEGK